MTRKKTVKRRRELKHQEKPERGFDGMGSLLHTFNIYSEHESPFRIVDVLKFKDNITHPDDVESALEELELTPNDFDEHETPLMMWAEFRQLIPDGRYYLLVMTKCTPGWEDESVDDHPAIFQDSQLLDKAFHDFEAKAAAIEQIAKQVQQDV